MSYEIVETEQTLSGKWQARVVIDADTTAFLSFPTAPTQEQVDIEAESWALRRRLAALQNTPPPESGQEAASSKLSKIDYMGLFTDVELAGIYSAAKTVVQIEVWLEKFKLSADIDLRDPRTIAGVMALEQFGLIGTGRAAQILAV